MPGEDECRRQQTEQPVSQAMKDLLASVPKIEFNPNALRDRLREEYLRELDR